MGPRSDCNHGIVGEGGTVVDERLRVTEGEGGLTVEAALVLESHGGSIFGGEGGGGSVWLRNAPFEVAMKIAGGERSLTNFSANVSKI